MLQPLRFKGVDVQVTPRTLDRNEIHLPLTDDKAGRDLTNVTTDLFLKEGMQENTLTLTHDPATDTLAIKGRELDSQALITLGKIVIRENTRPDELRGTFGTVIVSRLLALLRSLDPSKIEANTIRRYLDTVGQAEPYRSLYERAHQKRGLIPSGQKYPAPVSPATVLQFIHNLPDEERILIEEFSPSAMLISASENIPPERQVAQIVRRKGKLTLIPGVQPNTVLVNDKPITKATTLKADTLLTLKGKSHTYELYLS